MTIFRIFKLSVKEEELSYYEEVGQRNLNTSILTEPGTFAMYACHLPENPTSTVVAEVYADQAAYEAHVAAPHFHDFVKMAEQSLLGREVLDLEPRLLLDKPQSLTDQDLENLEVRLADIQIKPGNLEAFQASVTDEMRQAMVKEDGVLALYAGSLKDDPNHWFFFEIYASSQAYEAHRQTPHFQAYIQETRELVADKELTLLKADILVNKGGLNLDGDSAI